MENCVARYVQIKNLNGESFHCVKSDQIPVFLVGDKGLSFGESANNKQQEYKFNFRQGFLNSLPIGYLLNSLSSVAKSASSFLSHYLERLERSLVYLP